MTARRTVLSAALAFASLPGVVFGELSRKFKLAFVADATIYGQTARPGDEHFSFIIERLAQRGYANGRNLEARHFFARAGELTLDDVLHDALVWKPDALVAEGTLVARAARDATSSTPIVFVNVGDAIRSEVVMSIARPGGNVTGITTHNVTMFFKRLELIRELLPSARRVGVFWDRAFEYYPGFHDEYFATARGLNLEVIDGDVSRHHGDADKVMEFMAHARPAAAMRVMPWPSLKRPHSGALLADFQDRNGIPCVGDAPFTPSEVPRRVLAHMGTHAVEHYHRAADVVAQVFSGMHPRDIPIAQDSRIFLQLNLATARRLGIQVPKSVLIRADRLIE